MVFNSYFYQLERSRTTDLLVAVVFVLAMVGLVVEVVIMAVIMLVKYNTFLDFVLY